MKKYILFLLPLFLGLLVSNDIEAKRRSTLMATVMKENGKMVFQTAMGK